jgi:hypothetical protein
VFRRVGASVLIIADPDVPAERADSDPAAPWNLATALHAFHQAAFHASRDGAVVLQLRGFGATQPVKDPLVVSTWRPILAADQVPPALATLTNGADLAFLGRPRFFDGSRELLDLAGTGNPQLEYCERYESTPCALLWVSEPMRAAYREADRERELTTFGKLGVATTVAAPVAALLEPALEAAPVPQSLQARYDALAGIAEGYALDGNAQRLRLLTDANVRGGYSDEVGRAFLALEVRDGDHVMRGIVLVPGGTQRTAVSPGPDLVRRIDAALAHRPLSIQISGRLR